MAEFIIIGVATIAVFSLFLGVMALKEKRAAARPPVHTCANHQGCQCEQRSHRDACQAKQNPCDEPIQSSEQLCQRSKS